MSKPYISYIDPATMKDAAMLAELSAGATNYELIYGSLGLSWQTELRKRAEQAKFIRDLATQYGVDVAEISQTQANLPAAMETAVAIAQEDNATP